MVAGDGRSAGPFTILLIDDDPKFLEIVSEILERDGDIVRTASSGEAGLAQAHSARPDLILVDYHMPELTGLMTRFVA